MAQQGAATVAGYLAGLPKERRSAVPAQATKAKATCTAAGKKADMVKSCIARYEASRK
jgi:hypothetical protein